MCNALCILGRSRSAGPTALKRQLPSVTRRSYGLSQVTSLCSGALASKLSIYVDTRIAYVLLWSAWQKSARVRQSERVHVMLAIEAIYVMYVDAVCLLVFTLCQEDISSACECQVEQS